MRLRNTAVGAFVAALAGFGLAACHNDGPTTVATGPQAYVRFVNASPDSPFLTARFIDRVENMYTFDKVGFRGNSGYYIAVNAGTRNLRVFLFSGSSATGGANIDTASTIVLDTTLALEAATYYTVVQTGTVLPRRGSNTARVTVFTDTLPAATGIGADQILVRAYHLAGGADPVNLTLNKRAVVGTGTAATTTDSAVVGTISGLAAGSRSAYIAVPAVRTADASTLYLFSARSASSGATVVSARPDVPGQPFTAATATTPPLNPVGGVRQARSALSLFIFPAAVAGSPAAATATAAPTVDLIPDVNPPAP